MIKAQFVRRNLIKLIAPQDMTKKYYDNGPRSELLMLQSDQKAVKMVSAARGRYNYRFGCRDERKEDGRR